MKGLEHPYPVLSRIVDRAGQQFVLVTLASMDLCHIGTHNRPNGHVIDRLHDTGAFQLAVILTRPEADPADGRAVCIADQARYDAGADQRVQFVLVS